MIKPIRENAKVECNKEQTLASLEKRISRDLEERVEFACWSNDCTGVYNP